MPRTSARAAARVPERRGKILTVVTAAITAGWADGNPRANAPPRLTWEDTVKLATGNRVELVVDRLIPANPTD